MKAVGLLMAAVLIALVGAPTVAADGGEDGGPGSPETSALMCPIGGARVGEVPSRLMHCLGLEAN